MGWGEFWPDVVNDLVETEGISRQEAMSRASKLCKLEKQKKGDEKVTATKIKGAPSLKAEIEMVVQAIPDDAASWDIALGILDYLRDNAASKSDADVFRRQAAAARARAKGPTSEADSVEYRMGQAIGKTLLLVMADEGMTAADFVALTPPQLQANAGGIAGTVGAAGETLAGLLGITTDLDGDGDQAGISDAANAVGGGLVSLFEAATGTATGT